MRKSFTVTSEESTQRLDVYLVQKLSDISRSHIQKYIVSGDITVNGKPTKKHYAVQEGDVIEVHIEEEKVSFIPVAIPILYEDESILVIDKPVGVIVHPTETSREWTLVDFLKEHVPEIEAVGDSPARPGIVHRLDRGVSGVMVIAKTQEAFEHLKKQFQDRTVIKEYRAIVFGVPHESSGVIKFKIARSKTHGGKMAARPEHAEGKEAWTEYDVIRSIHDRFSEVIIRIKTGRTHQIRVHFAALDHPVVGDTLYQSKHYKSKKEYPRILLHSSHLSFIHPTTQEKVDFESPLPKEFEEFDHS